MSFIQDKNIDKKTHTYAEIVAEAHFERLRCLPIVVLQQLDFGHQHVSIAERLVLIDAALQRGFGG